MSGGSASGTFRTCFRTCREARLHCRPMDSRPGSIRADSMPHLWMFLLQASTPAGHKVLLIDGNTLPMSDVEIVHFVLAKGIGLVGIGAMTRMIAKAYQPTKT